MRISARDMAQMESYPTPPMNPPSPGGRVVRAAPHGMSAAVRPDRTPHKVYAGRDKFGRILSAKNAPGPRPAQAGPAAAATVKPPPTRRGGGPGPRPAAISPTSGPLSGMASLDRIPQPLY